MKNTESITNDIRVDRWSRIKLADLRYSPRSDRADDCGGLYVAPLVSIRGCDASVGQLLVYATTNGDPIRLGYITDGHLTWVRSSDMDSGMDESMMETLQQRAEWSDPPDGEGWSYVVRDAVTDVTLDDLDYL